MPSTRTSPCDERAVQGSDHRSLIPPFVFLPSVRSFCPLCSFLNEPSLDIFFLVTSSIPSLIFKTLQLLVTVSTLHFPHRANCRQWSKKCEYTFFSACGKKGKEAVISVKGQKLGGAALRLLGRGNRTCLSQFQVFLFCPFWVFFCLQQNDSAVVREDVTYLRLLKCFHAE